MSVKIQGKPSGWTGPATEYQENKGSAGRKRIVFIGASYKFVHKVLRDMMLVGGFNECHLVLHDIDEVPLKIVGDLLDRMIKQSGTRITLSRTLDRQEALKHADAVILSITIGGRESDFRSFEVCQKYGIPVGIGDTLGPPALARNLRTLPFVDQLVTEMENACPNAVLLNFTNPLSCITATAARRDSILSMGLCHSGDELYTYFSRIFNCHKNEVELTLAGVNHQSFVSSLRIRGQDRINDVLETSRTSQVQLEDSLNQTRETTRLQQEMFKFLKAWPSTGEEHLAEFYPYHFTPRALERYRFGHMKELKAGRSRFERTPCPEIIKDWAYGPEGVGDLHLLSEEHAHEIMWAVFTGEPYTRVLNVINKDEIVKDIPRDACVEVVATITNRKISSPQIKLPTVAHALVQRWTAIHDLTIQAALKCDKQAALQALLLDPHVRELSDVEPLLNDLIATLEPWLPQAWQKQ